MLRCLLILAVVVGLSVAGLQVANAQAETVIRVVNASRESVAYDVYVDGALTFFEVPYQTYTNTIKAEPTKYTVEIRPAGAADTSAPVLKSEIELAAGKQYTLVIAGSPKGTENVALQIFLVTTEPTGANRARLNLIHAVPGATGIDLLSETDVIVNNLLFGQAIGLPINQGAYKFAIVPTGNAGSVIIDLPSERLVTGISYTYIVIGNTQQTEILRIADGPMLLGAINGSPNTPPVDIYVDGQKFAEGLEYGKFSNLFTLQGKYIRVELRLSGTAPDSEPIFADRIQIPGGVVANLIVSGKLNGQGTEAMVLSGFWGAAILPEGRSGLYLINAVPGGLPLALSESGTSIIDGVAYRDIGSVSGPAGKYNLLISDGTRGLIDLPAYELQAGKNHFIIVTGTADKVDSIRFFSDTFATMNKQ